MKNVLIIFIVIAGFFFFPSIALAHNPIPGSGSFYSGMFHPVSVPAHLLMLVGMALWLGKNQRLEKYFLALFFPLLLGLMVAILNPSIVLPSLYLTFGAIIAGILVAIDKSMRSWIEKCFLGFQMCLMGLDSGVGENISVDVLIMASGVFLGILLIVMNLAIGRTFLKKDWMQIGVRVLGSWIAASSMMVFALALRKQGAF